MILSSIYSTVRSAMAPVAIGACLFVSGLAAVGTWADGPSQRAGKEARDLSRQVQRAAYLAKVDGMSDRELLAAISHKLDLLLALEHHNGLERQQSAR